MMTLKKKLRKPLLLIENPRKGKNMKKSIKVTEKWKKKKKEGNKRHGMYAVPG